MYLLYLHEACELSTKTEFWFSFQRVFFLVGVHINNNSSIRSTNSAPYQVFFLLEFPTLKLIKLSSIFLMKYLGKIPRLTLIQFKRFVRQSYFVVSKETKLLNVYSLGNCTKAAAFCRKSKHANYLWWWIGKAKFAVYMVFQWLHSHSAAPTTRTKWQSIER